ncbi:hypothetical protein KVR01_004469 [Diaporthe batatas]|uniref:uncharacterized protein n=1 Tax=Diaporthe batatas TaxID=748121 RepID=UPI001D0373B1|nr:uncharacterized protein KVR01_004469 [Diaporthe batatas]KAG8165917.1 hypothetical protein KVR01_004469 [Diaporthe batatas]
MLLLCFALLLDPAVVFNLHGAASPAQLPGQAPASGRVDARCYMRRVLLACKAGQSSFLSPCSICVYVCKPCMSVPVGGVFLAHAAGLRAVAALGGGFLFLVLLSSFFFFFFLDERISRLLFFGSDVFHVMWIGVCSRVGCPVVRCEPGKAGRPPEARPPPPPFPNISAQARMPCLFGRAQPVTIRAPVSSPRSPPPFASLTTKPTRCGYTLAPVCPSGPGWWWW